jgi:hypothetical protein
MSLICTISFYGLPNAHGADLRQRFFVTEFSRNSGPWKIKVVWMGPML